MLVSHLKVRIITYIIFPPKHLARSSWRYFLFLSNFTSLKLLRKKHFIKQNCKTPNSEGLALLPFHTSALPPSQYCCWQLQIISTARESSVKKVCKSVCLSVCLCSTEISYGMKEGTERHAWLVRVDRKAEMNQQPTHSTRPTLKLNSFQRG